MSYLFSSILMYIFFLSFLLVGFKKKKERRKKKRKSRNQNHPNHFVLPKSLLTHFYTPSSLTFLLILVKNSSYFSMHLSCHLEGYHFDQPNTPVLIHLSTPSFFFPDKNKNSTLAPKTSLGLFFLLSQ